MVEQQLAVVSADGDEVGAGPGVVICGEPDGAAMVEVGVVQHGNDDMRSALRRRGVNGTVFGTATSQVGCDLAGRMRIEWNYTSRCTNPDGPSGKPEIGRSSTFCNVFVVAC